METGVPALPLIHTNAFSQATRIQERSTSTVTDMKTTMVIKYLSNFTKNNAEKL